MLAKFKQLITLLVCFCLAGEQAVFAQTANSLDLSGYISGSPADIISRDRFRPFHLRSLLFDEAGSDLGVILDSGDTGTAPSGEVAAATKTLLKYFFVGLSLPNDSFWVNLRPDSEDNVVDPELARTDVARILLEADVQLKKDTARMTSPERPEGRAYWDRLYRRAEELLGTDEVSIPTVVRPWIVPGEILIRESGSAAYIYKATLKVMLEQDYLKGSSEYGFTDSRLKALNEYSAQLIRELVIPGLVKEINTSRRYAPLRQVYYSLILAQWYKTKFRGGQGALASRIDRKDLEGLTSREAWSKSDYYAAYRKSFSEGEYDLKRKAPGTNRIRSYFSGGVVLDIYTKTAGTTVVDFQGTARVLVPETGDFIPVRVNAADITGLTVARGDGGAAVADDAALAAAIRADNRMQLRWLSSRMGARQVFQSVLDDRVGLNVQRAEGETVSEWEEAVGRALTRGNFSLQEKIREFSAFLSSPRVTALQETVILKQLALLSKDDAEGVLSYITEGYAPVKLLIEQAVNPGNAGNEHVTARKKSLQTIFSAYFGLACDGDALEQQQAIAGAFVDSVRQKLAKGRTVDRGSVDAGLLEKALALVEPATRFEPALLGLGAGPAYFRQLFRLTDLFLTASRMLNEGRFNSFDEVMAELGKKGAMEGLNRAQLAKVKCVVLQVLAQKLDFAREYEEAMGTPGNPTSLALFAQAARDIQRLDHEKAKAQGFFDIDGERRINAELREKVDELEALKPAVTGFLEKRFGIKVDPMLVTIGRNDIAFEIEMDERSLQEAVASVGQTQNSADRDLRVLGRGKLDPNKLEAELASFVDRLPEYVLGDLQDELVAYMTEGALRTWNIDMLLDFYLFNYKASVMQDLREGKFFDYQALQPEARARMDELFEQAWADKEGAEVKKWENLRAMMRQVKDVLNRIVDAEATLIYREKRASLAPGSRVDDLELRKAALAQASKAVGALMQLISLFDDPRRMAYVLRLEKRELAARGISDDEIIDMHERQYERIDYTQAEQNRAGGFMFQGGMFMVMGAGPNVREHEFQHLIFGLFTGREAYSRNHSLVDFGNGVRELARMAEVPLGAGQADGGLSEAERNGIESMLSFARATADETAVERAPGVGETGKRGGIDLTRLPVMAIGVPPALGLLDQAQRQRLASIDVGAESRKIMKMLEGGIAPSDNRMKEYVLACCVENRLAGETEGLLACFAAFLRMQEAEAIDTDPVLRELLLYIEKAS